VRNTNHLLECLSRNYIGENNADVLETFDFRILNINPPVFVEPPKRITKKRAIAKTMILGVLAMFQGSWKV
jgi:hypothetical protein